MINLKYKIKTQAANKVVLNWTAEGKGLGKYFLQILRCESRFGPFEPICEPFLLERTQEFIDNLPSPHIDRRWYYQFKIIRGDNIQLIPPHEGISTELRNDKFTDFQAKEHVTFLRVHGRSAIYYPIRTWGERCPVCYDAATNARLKQNCDACWNTTFAKGFLNPVKIYTMLFEFGESQLPARIGGSETPARQIDLPWYIDPKNGDVVILDDGVRLFIKSPIQKIKKRNILIYSLATAIPIEYGNILYNLPADGAGEIPQHLRYTI